MFLTVAGLGACRRPRREWCTKMCLALLMSDHLRKAERGGEASKHGKKRPDVRYQCLSHRKKTISSMKLDFRQPLLQMKGNFPWTH